MTLSGIDVIKGECWPQIVIQCCYKYTQGQCEHSSASVAVCLAVGGIIELKH